jgi:alpha-amylase/alpha-mannosidase (GH57 family)
MQVWHGTPDAPRPQGLRPGEPIELVIGTWPIEAGQEIAVELTVTRPGADAYQAVLSAEWQHNTGPNSYWRATIGPFRADEQVHYAIHGRVGGQTVEGPDATFRVGERLPVALLWHFHQPLYRDDSAGEPYGRHRMPWVRLHALRDYYAMPALLLEHPEVHVTINVTPVLLDQLLDYAEGRAWDDALVLTRASAGRLLARDRESLLSTFFEADWHGQIFPHRRYTELFTRRLQGLPFRAGDLRDLQVWFTLAWFNQAFRDGPVKLVTGDTTEVHRLVAKGRGFSQRDVEALLAEQTKVLRAIVPLLRLLEARGQVELSTTPYYHPILPLLIDSDSAATELAQVRLPARFAHPEDAEAQVRLALARHAEVFGRAPRGVWPAEGAVSQEAATLLARQGLRWFASDAGVLGRSGVWGYRVDQPDVASRPYRVGEGANAIVGFFRDPWLSDRIGFDYHRVEERTAADQFVAQIKERIAKRLESPAGHVATIALDGENPWGAYRQDGRAFLQVLYQRLADDPALVTVTFSEFQDGNPERGVPAHPPADLELLQPLATGSWIDEPGSQPGVDLGTWIGEPEENAAWVLLARAREEIPVSAEAADPGESAIRPLYAAEGSDWFWWLGRDQDSGRDQEFDDLFRGHLLAAYRASGRAPPPALDRHLVPHAVTWSHVAPVQEIQEGDDLIVVTNCPGSLEWRYDDGIPQQSPLFPVTGALGGLGRHRLNLAPIPPDTRAIEFRFRCAHEGCGERSPCRDASWRRVSVLAAGRGAEASRPEATTTR